MKIHNLRFGFANNSSSTHSIVLLRPEKLGGVVDDISYYNEAPEFGWDYFTAASKEAKKNYLGALFYSSLRHLGIDAAYSGIISKHLAGIDVLGGVDHQSAISIPYDFDRKSVNQPFFDALSSYIVNNDNIVITGGNDNDDSYHPLCDSVDESVQISHLGLPVDDDHYWIVRYDEPLGYFTLFNYMSGSKIRVSFDNEKFGNLHFGPKKSSWPELVDIKITQYCNYGCNFCYQGSTKEGKHASFEHLESVIDTLAGMEVFEIAFGGGEPTQHPDFVKILKHTHSKGISANFTTKNLKWLKEHWVEIEPVYGSFAFSIEGIRDLRDIISFINYHEIPHHKASVQFVMGTGMYCFPEIVKICDEEHIRLTLLGFKQQERGVKYKQNDYANWIQIVKENASQYSYNAIGIDTALAEQFESELLADGVPRVLFTTEEGQFSCYYDAVERKIAPSSYCHPDEYSSYITKNTRYENTYEFSIWFEGEYTKITNKMSIV